MIDNKDNEIILCKGIKLDRNYENVLSYSESDMVTLCRNNAIYQADKYNFIEKANNKIVVSHPYSSAMYANYLAFKNPRFGNKWIFAWVTDVKLINIGSTEITFEVDVWSTWYSKFSIGQAFIEREHVSDDTIGLHTIPEGLETGDFIVNAMGEIGALELNYHRIVICYTSNPTSVFPTNTSGNEYTGLYTGYKYMVLASPVDADQMIKGFANSTEGSLESIVAIFTIPTSLIRSSVHWYNGINPDPADVVEVGGEFPMFALLPPDPSGSHNEITIKSNATITINSTINGYTPKNNKLFTSQFNYLYITNNTGGDITMNYEDFINNSPSFDIIGAISIGQNIKLIPQNYKKYNTTSASKSLYAYGLNASKYPTLGWTGDIYTNWLTQNAVNIGVSAFGNVTQIAGGIALLGGALMTGGATALAGGASILSGVTGIANQIGEIRKHQLVSETGKGNVNAGDLAYSSDKMSYTYYQMSIKSEYASVIDKYFSRFGYKVNEVKTPNLNSRTQFNFIKVGGMDELVHGDIPSTDLEKINEICRKGVTIFHNYTNIGDYTISNPIVTP